MEVIRWGELAYLIVWIKNPQYIGCWLCGTGLCSDPVLCCISDRGHIQLQPAQRWKALGALCCDGQMILQNLQKGEQNLWLLTYYLHSLVPLTPLQFG